MKSDKRSALYKILLNILLALAGIGLMAFYSSCDTSCSYLKGDIFGMDLKYIGIAFMLAAIILSVSRQTDLLRLILAGGIGGEVFLVAFQFQENVFCPFCLGFGTILVIMCIINYEKPQMKNRWYEKILYATGEAKIPFTGIRLPLLAVILLGYLFITFVFNGSATPSYGADQPAAPSYGSGPTELLVFTDYFCPPCQNVEGALEPAIQSLLTRGNVKVTFVDMPLHKPSSLYIRYFLFAVHSSPGYKNAMRARHILFKLATQNTVTNAQDLEKQLIAQGVALQPFDPRPIYDAWTHMSKRYGVDSTPTCLLKYSETDIRTYKGGNEIRTKLIPELQALGKKSRKGPAGNPSRNSR